MPLSIPDQTIASQVKVPDMLTTLNGIMNYKNAQQANRAYQISNDANAANLQEKTALRDLVNDPSVQNPDGSLNQDKFTARAQVVAPTLGAGVAQGNLGNQSAQIANNTNKFRLSSDQFAKSMEFAGGLIQDPNVIAASDPSVMNDPAKIESASQGIMQSLSDAEDRMVSSGIPKLTAKSMLSPLYMAATHNPAQVRTMLANVIQQGVGASGQAAQSLVPAGSQQALGSDLGGRPTVVSKDQFGNIRPIAGAQVQGDPSRITPQVLPATETPQSYGDLQKYRSDTNQAASSVPDQHFNNREIIDLIDKNKGSWISPTGSNAAALAKISGMIGVPVSGDFATDANKISHFLALQTQANEKVMGVSTDAGRMTANIAAGSIAQTPQSLRTAVEVNDAGTTGLDFFNRGMEAAVKTGGIPAVRDFRNAWSQNYDPNAMRLYNANKNNDPTAAADVMKTLGGKNSPKFQALLQKAKNLELLSTQGHL